MPAPPSRVALGDASLLAPSYQSPEEVIFLLASPVSWKLLESWNAGLLACLIRGLTPRNTK